MAFTREERRKQSMPVLESTDRIAPRSVLRHRPIGGNNVYTGRRSQTTTASIPIVKRASRPQPQIAETPMPADEAEVDEWQRDTDDDEGENGDDASKTHLQIPVRRVSTSTASKPLPRTPFPSAPSHKRFSLRNAHPMLYLGIGMLGMIVLWTVLVSFISWYSTTMDDIHYGRPRTSQMDYYVGHNESPGNPSHFIAINLHGHIEVIEFPGGDASHARIFLGPQLFTTNSDLVVVTLRFIDVNGDHKPDMVVNFQGSQVVFINDQGTFRPLSANERPAVEQFLQQHP